jgi:hypothetical protein
MADQGEARDWWRRDSEVPFLSYQLDSVERPGAVEGALVLRSPAVLIDAGEQTSFPSVLQAITFTSGANGRRMVQQPIQNRGRDDGIAKDRSPISVAFVGSQDDAAAFVTSTDQLKEDGCAHVIQRLTTLFPRTARQ